MEPFALVAKNFSIFSFLLGEEKMVWPGAEVEGAGAGKGGRERTGGDG